MNLTMNAEQDNLHTTIATQFKSIRNEWKNIINQNKSGIYKIINKIDGKYYIGSAKCFYTRWTRHLKTLLNNCHANDYLQNAWNKYGYSAFEFQIVEFHPTEILLEKEQYYLNIAFAEQNNCYNLTFKAKGGFSEYARQKLTGRTISITTRQKISNLKKGILHSEEHKQNISNSMKNRKLSNSHIEKLKTSHTGLRHSLEAKLKMSKIRVGKRHSQETKEKIRNSLKARLSIK